MAEPKESDDHETESLIDARELDRAGRDEEEVKLSAIDPGDPTADWYQSIELVPTDEQLKSSFASSPYAAAVSTLPVLAEGWESGSKWRVSVHVPSPTGPRAATPRCILISAVSTTRLS
jgi:hypothetical protein